MKKDSRSLSEMLAEFFVNNPDEQLTLQDIQEKYDIAHAAVEPATAIAVANGVIRATGLSNGYPVFGAGLKLKAPKPAKTGGRVVQHRFDPNAIPIEKNTPVPTQRGGGAHSKWAILLGRLDDVGDSAPLPQGTRQSCYAYIHKKEKEGVYPLGKFRAGTDSAGQPRVWRTA
jgi:hypothetical protein